MDFKAIPLPFVQALVMAVVFGGFYFKGRLIRQGKMKSFEEKIAALPDKEELRQKMRLVMIVQGGLVAILYAVAWGVIAQSSSNTLGYLVATVIVVVILLPEQQLFLKWAAYRAKKA